MAGTDRGLQRLRPRARFLGLLLALWSTLILPHVLRQVGAFGVSLLTAVAFVALLARTLAFDERLSRVGRLSLGVLVAAMGLREGGDLDANSTLGWGVLLLELLGTAGVTYEVLRYLSLPVPVDLDKIYAAACGYLLFGLLFATTFELLSVIEPGGMSAPLSDRVAYRYFSFVTLSTLGYGDISPTLPLTRMLAVSEAILGQLYLAMVVALLVGRFRQGVEPN